MAPEDITHIRPEGPLVIRLNSINERPNETQITPTVPATLVQRLMARRHARAEVRRSEGGHVTHELAMREVQTRLAFALGQCVCDHGERRCDAIAEFQVDDLEKTSFSGEGRGGVHVNGNAASGDE